MMFSLGGVQLERWCPRCRGDGRIAEDTACPRCEGKGIMLTDRGRELLRFLERHDVPNLKKISSKVLT